MGRIFTCGDTHGKTDLKKIRKWDEAKTLTKQDVLIQLGDFGWVWYPIGSNPEQEYWVNWLATRKYTLFVVLGNHENYDQIYTLPVIEKFGGKVRELKSKGRHGEGSIYFAERGEVYNINGKTFWCFGGALSNDKEYRTLGKDYWSQEQPTWDEFIYGKQSLDKVDYKIDYILTHTCPLNIMCDIIHRTPYTEGKFKDPVAEYLWEIYKKVTFKEWRFGHMHEDIKLEYSDTNDGIFYCQYNGAPIEIC
jgi:predicted phosphodiesterase